PLAHGSGHGVAAWMRCGDGGLRSIRKAGRIGRGDRLPPQLGRHCHVGECGRPGRIRGVTTATPSYEGHRYPVEIINHCVWLYFRFPLSFREVEELMLVRGVAVSYETSGGGAPSSGMPTPTSCAGGARAPATSGTSTRCSSGPTAGCGTCGARSTSTATCSTFSSSHAETRWRPSDSSVSCSRACGTAARAGHRQAGQLPGRPPRAHVVGGAPAVAVSEQPRRELSSAHPT